MALIEFTNVSKSFPHNSGRALLRTHIVRWFGAAHQENFYAVRGASFQIERGESVGLIGRNGAGKSTVLSLIAGIARPNGGSVSVNGRVAALLELGSGFHPDLTGAENLILNAALLGLSRKQTSARFDRIVEFSGIEDSINDPLRTYSSGMVMRLAFSIAIHTDPDILLIDEVLAVGDANFQAKCFTALSEHRTAGKSLIFVSHTAETVQKMCERALWIDNGEVVMDGVVTDVLLAYAGKSLEPRV